MTYEQQSFEHSKWWDAYDDVAQPKAFKEHSGHVLGFLVCAHALKVNTKLIVLEAAVNGVDVRIQHWVLEAWLHLTLRRFRRKHTNVVRAR